jgi:hypothetical protein
MPTVGTLIVPEQVQSAESLFFKLAQLQRNYSVVHLKLPMRVRGTGFGATAAVMQLAATWASLYRTLGHIEFPIQFDDIREGGVQALRTADHLLYAVFLGAPIFADGGAIDISEKIADPARELLRRRRNDATDGTRDEVPDSSFMALTVDKLPSYAPRSLYASGSSRNAVSEVFNDYHPLGDAVLKLRGWRPKAVPDGRNVSALSWAIFELFQNTHQWGKSVPSSERRSGEVEVAYSCRAVQARYQSFTTNSLTAANRTNQHFRQFVEDRLNSSPDGSTLRLIEVSIIDNGIGAGRRQALKSHPDGFTPEEELRALRAAMGYRRSTSTDILKGIGFHRAFMHLSELQGFLVVRSGSWFVVRDFNRIPYPTERELIDIRQVEEGRWTDFEDGLGVTDVPFAVKSAPAVGTRVTLVVPIAGFFPSRSDGSGT